MHVYLDDRNFVYRTRREARMAGPSWLTPQALPGWHLCDTEAELFGIPNIRPKIVKLTVSFENKGTKGTKGTKKLIKVGVLRSGDWWALEDYRVGGWCAKEFNKLFKVPKNKKVLYVKVVMSKA